MDIKQTILSEIKTSGKTRYRISKESGVDQSQLCRLANGKTLTAEAYQILLAYFGYELKKK